MDLSNINWGLIAIQFVALLFSLSVHEAAHAWMADRCGDYTARYLGRVTLNPMAHIDPIGTIVFPLLQLVTHIPLIGWAKPVPVNPMRMKNPTRDQMYVSVAGPVSNLLVGTCAFILLLVLKHVLPKATICINHMVDKMNLPADQSLIVPILGLLFFLMVINFMLAVFNLIPVPPLDGHWIVAGLLPPSAAESFRRIGSYGIFVLWGLMIMGAFQFIMIPIYVILAILKVC